jgi:hypothetical protein
MKFAGIGFLLVLVFSGCTASGAAPSLPSPLQKDPLFQEASQSAMPSIPVQPSHKRLSAEYSASIIGSGSHLVGDISVVGNTGTIQVRGVKVPTFIQENIPWTAKGYTLYWVYCQRGKMASVYLEAVDGLSLENEPASGSCELTEQDTSFEVSVPDIALKPIKPVKGFEINGDQVYLSPESGLGIVDWPELGEKYLFAPFSKVDCSDCGTTGWHELHSLFWNESMNRVCFGIIYLQNQSPSEISISYSMCFPDLERALDGVKIQSVWTVPVKPTA